MNNHQVIFLLSSESCQHSDVQILQMLEVLDFKFFGEARLFSASFSFNIQGQWIFSKDLHQRILCPVKTVLLIYRTQSQTNRICLDRRGSAWASFTG